MSKDETPEEKKLREKLEAEAERATAPDSANYTDDEALGSIFGRIKRKGK